MLISIAIILPSASSEGGPCEEVPSRHLYAAKGAACFMRFIAINSTDFLITSPRNELFVVFFARYNKKLQYLPSNLGEKFPNLLSLFADGCSIEELSKENFKGLNKLNYLELSDNQIETINDDVFEYTPEIKGIDLGEQWSDLNNCVNHWKFHQIGSNKIKKINGRAFASLELTSVVLRGNECIDELFSSDGAIAKLPRIVTEKCGFGAVEIVPLFAEIIRLEAEMKVMLWELRMKAMLVEKYKEKMFRTLGLEGKLPRLQSAEGAERVMSYFS